MKKKKFEKYYFKISVILFFITICLSVYYFWAFPETQIEKLRGVITGIIGILSALGLNSILKKELKSYWMLSIFLNIAILFLWFLMLPIHQIYFEIYPNDTDILLNNDKVLNPVQGLSARFYKFRFEKNNYKPDSLLVNPLNIIFKKDIQFELEKKVGLLLIETNVNDVNILLKDTKSYTSNDYGSISYIQLKYGEYKIIGSKNGYYPDSLLVHINRDTINIRLELDEIKYNVKLLTESGTLIYLVSNNTNSLLTTADINGYANIIIGSGTHLLLFKKGSNTRLFQISVPDSREGRINVPLSGWN